MKVTIWKHNLKEGLDVAERTVAKSSALPVLQNVYLEAKKGSIKIAATDLQMGISYYCVGNTEEEGSVVFPGRFLSSLLSIFSEEQISLHTEKNSLVVICGGHEARIHTLDAEEFPIIPSVGQEESYIEVETGVWSRALGQVVGVAGQSQTRPEIAGVLVMLEGSRAKLVATDSFRLAEKTITLEAGGKAEQSFILPQKSAREVMAVLGERQGKVKIYASATQSVFDYASEEGPSRVQIQIVSRLIEGEYPRYEDVIPRAEQTKLQLHRGDLISHVKAAGVFAGKTNELRFTVSPEKSNVSLFSQNNEAGEHSSTLNGTVEGEAVEIAFNWRFLMEGLLQFKSDIVEFSLNGEDGPALLRGQEQEGYRYVIMPIKA